ncbi:MAG: hypothetical protein J5701_06150 [Bacteroidales bacterium]|nr:hypothetical protein [Bacteroidales bacterium]
MIVKLKNELYNMLNNSIAKKYIKSMTILNPKYVKVCIEEDDMLNIREWACDELQKKGFDETYALTNEGENLEELIDIFIGK